MAPEYTAKSLEDKPTGLLQEWIGYFRNTDPTVLPPNALTFPSINCFIPEKDRIEPRQGKTLLGQAFTTTKNWPIIGHKKRFTTMGGIETEIRVVRSDDASLRDIVEVLYPHPVTGIKQWYRITQSVNPLTIGVHRYYFDDWFDSNINASASLNLSRLIWVNGLSQIFSWTGGIAPIVSFVVNTSVSTISGVTWASLGFVDPALGGSGNIVINGTLYAVSGGWNTSTLLIANTTGIAVNDVAFSQIETDATTAPIDMCRNNKGYMFYGNWKSRYLQMSNAFNRPASEEITSVQAVQNDLIVSGVYTGTTQKKVRYQIDSIISAPQSFFYGQATDPNNLFFSGQHVGTARDVYRVVITDATVGAPKYQVFKNNSSVATNQTITYDTPTSLPGATSDGIKITFVHIDDTVSPYTVGQAWTYVVGGQDTYSIYVDGVIVGAAGRNASTTYTTDGVSFKVNSTSGHALGDYWETTLDPAITEAWHNFYYTLPVRKPGEAYNFQLPSNFWTMAPQEKYMYVNTTYGQWGFIETELSADLQSESVNYEPMKQAASSKVIFPYMIDYLDNDLIYVTENKTLDMIGRKEFVELPQIGNLSDPVKLDFDEASFEDGSMEFFDKKLWITSPRETVMFCWDDLKKYWQPPQVIIENGILSIVENTLISHSNLRNQTFTLFSGQSDDGSAFTVRIRTAYNSYGDRWALKNSNMTFLEGYITGNPPLVMKVIQGINGCGDILPHTVRPIVCITPDRAPLGAGSFGSHSLGSDVFNEDSHFNEIKKLPGKNIEYRLAALELECSTQSHTYRILTMAMNAILSNKGNNDVVVQDVISEN